MGTRNHSQVVFDDVDAGVGEIGRDAQAGNEAEHIQTGLHIFGEPRPQAPLFPRGLFFFRRFGDHRRVGVAACVGGTAARSQNR